MVENHENSPPSHLVEVIRNENPYTAAAPDEAPLANNVNELPQSSPEFVTRRTSSATESGSDKYNTSDQGSMTFPVNGNLLFDRWPSFHSNSISV